MIYERQPLKKVHKKRKPFVFLFWSRRSPDRHRGKGKLLVQNLLANKKTITKCDGLF